MHTSSRFMFCTSALLVALAVAHGAKADSITTNLGVLDSLMVTEVKNGRMFYKNRLTGAQGDKQLGQVKKIQVDQVPAVDAVFNALTGADANDRVALRELAGAIAKARNTKQKTWLVPYLQFQQLGCHKRLGDVVAAVRVYCELAQDKGDPYYFAEPVGIAPEKTLVGLIGAADENTRKVIFERIRDSRKGMASEYMTYLDMLAKATGITEAVPAPNPGDPGKGPGPNVGKTGNPTPGVTVRPGALLLTTKVLRAIQENSAESGDMQMAVAGRYGDALAAMKTALKTKGTLTGQRLFVLGRVQQELAETEKDPGKKDILLKEAALCFARVGAQFHDEESGYYQASLLELARIHHAWGNIKVVDALMKDIASYGNTVEDPAYVKRYLEFKTVVESGK